MTKTGSQLSSDGGLRVMRELDVALGLSDLATMSLTDTRTGKNTTHRLDDEWGVARVLAVRERGGRDHAIGRFLMTEDGLRPDFGPDNGPEIAHHIRTVRDLNGAIGSLAGVACVFDAKRSADGDTPEP